MRLERRTRRNLHRISSTLERAERIGREQLNKPFAVFVHLMPYMTAESVQGLVIIPPPKRLLKADIPDTLNGVDFGMLTRLQQAPKGNDYLRTCCALVGTLTGIAPERVASCRAYDVLGIVNMITAEMERIGKLFASLQSEKTSDEINAGIDRLDFGTFGIVDWYAKRMGIVDHEDVFKTPWVRVYQCLKIDHENMEFEKRFRKIIENRSKIKR